MTRKSLKDRTTLHWNQWHSNNVVSFESTISGVGRGEQKIVEEYVLRGSPAQLHGGYEHSYDILDKYGAKWEVKEIDSSLEIRPGKDGIRSADEIVDVLRDVFFELDRTFQKYSHRSPLSDFVMKGKSKVQEGSIPKGLVFGGTNENPIGLIKLLQELADDVNGSQTTKIRAEIIVDGTRFDRQFDLLDLMKIVPYTGVKTSLEEMMFKEIREMKHAKFVLEPAMIEDLWRSSSMASKAFKYVDGLILTNEIDGYALLKTQEVDDHLTFERVSAGKSKFKLVQRKRPPVVKQKELVQTEFDFS